MLTVPLHHVPSLSYSHHTEGPSASHKAPPHAHFAFWFHQSTLKFKQNIFLGKYSFSLMPCTEVPGFSALWWPGTGAELQCWEEKQGNLLWKTFLHTLLSILGGILPAYVGSPQQTIQKLWLALMNFTFDFQGNGLNHKRWLPNLFFSHHFGC